MGHAGAIRARRGKQCPQDGPKMDPRGVWGAPRAAHETPRGLQRDPWGRSGGPKRDQEGPKRAPRGPKTGPKEAWKEKNAKSKNVKKPLVFIGFWPPGRPKMAPKRVTWSHLGGCQVILEPLGAAELEAR